jgi:amino acid transporter
MSRSLSLFNVILFGLAFMALVTVFSTYGIASQLSHGMVAGSYVLALVVMLFTAYSYGQMAKAYPVAGSAYTYAQKSIGPEVGFLVGWAILMDYLFIPMVNYLLFGIFFHAAFPEIPPAVFILFMLILVTVINLRGVKIAARANLIVILSSVLFLLIFCILAVKEITSGTGTGMLVNMKPFFNPDESFKYVVAGAALLCFSFLGFDSVSAFSEETINPRKNIPRAIFIITLTGGILFSTVAYFAHNVWPDYMGFTDPDAAAYDIIGLVGGSFLKSLFLVIYGIVVFGSALTSQASGARVLYAMGRDGQLPTFFGKLHPVLKTPINNIILISVLSLLALFLSLSLVASFINFGAFLAFICVNISVIVLYFGKKKLRSFKGLIFFLLIPAIGALLDIWLLINLDKHSIMVGSIWFILGLIYLIYLTKGFKKRAPQLAIDTGDEQSSDQHVS